MTAASRPALHDAHTHREFQVQKEMICEDLLARTMENPDGILEIEAFTSWFGELMEKIETHQQRLHQIE